MSRKLAVIVLLLVACQLLLPAQSKPATSGSGAFEHVMDRVIEREAGNIKALREYSPVVETYLQLMRPDKDLGAVPVDDRYFLGRVAIHKDMDSVSFLQNQKMGGFAHRLFHRATKVAATHSDFRPDAFSYMLVMDARGLDRSVYSFEYVGREFIGELRCIVIDVKPKQHSGYGRFEGRIWVEDQGYNVVRFNGTFLNPPNMGVYLHFDTWRLNLQPDAWLPAYVFTEEASVEHGLPKNTGYKGQIRIWGYNVGRSRASDTFTEVLVDPADSVSDLSNDRQDLSPVAAQRSWERQAEDNVLERMQRAGLLAPVGEVDKVLNTVVANLEITNNLDIVPEVRCRVLLTSPIESFTVGHTIVMSRGMLDVLPDEASLAAVLAHELAHIALGHKVDTRYAFSDRTIFADEFTFQRFHFARDSKEEQEADTKAIALLGNSPYKDKLANVGLFLRAMESRQKALPHLIRAEMGNTLSHDGKPRLAELMANAPELAPLKTDQLAALPLGGRIKVDPWSNQVEISHAKSVPLLGAREKMPFEVTPVFPFLTRYGSIAPAANPAPATPAATPAVAPGTQPPATPTNDPGARPHSENNVATTSPSK